MILRLSAANANGATIQAVDQRRRASLLRAAGGQRGPTADWHCRKRSTRSGINELSLNADTMSPSADRPGDARELAFVMQASRVRLGQ